MKYIIFTILLLTACATNSLKPSIFTNPPDYLTTIPLNTISESSLIANIGPPDNTSQILGYKALVYEVGEGYGKRTFSYLISNGIVADVIYHDNGPYNGMRASTSR